MKNENPMMNPKFCTPSLIAFLMIIVSFANAQETVYNNFGPGHDGWDYNYGLGWTISGNEVTQQYGVEQAMGFESSANGIVSDIWLAVSYVPMSAHADTVIIRLVENPLGLPPDSAYIMEEWILTSFDSWSQWNTPLHLEGNGTTQVQTGKSYWLWAIAKEETWAMWCMNEDASLTCPHTIRRENENWLNISDETAGVFRVDVIQCLGISDSYADLIQGFSLDQNYPNPFHNSTSISYSLENSQKVSLVINDMFGREIQTLVNEFQTAGSYIVNFDGSQLPQGFYIYKLQVGNQFVDVKKMSRLR